MSIAIFGSYSYWNDGIGWSEFSERGEIKEVVENAANRWFKYKESMIIEDVIGVDASEIQTLIEDRYHQLIEEDKLCRRIHILKVSIRHSQQWLDNRDAETERLTKLIAENTAELLELTR